MWRNYLIKKPLNPEPLGEWLLSFSKGLVLINNNFFIDVLVVVC